MKRFYSCNNKPFDWINFPTEDQNICDLCNQKLIFSNYGQIFDCLNCNYHIGRTGNNKGNFIVYKVCYIDHFNNDIVLTPFGRNKVFSLKLTTQNSIADILNYVNYFLALQKLRNNLNRDFYI